MGLEHLCDIDILTVAAHDGIEALRLCEEHVFDAIITDYSMPNMDGLEFIKQFRNLNKKKSIPIIFTTAFSSELGMEINSDLFANVIFMDKPYKFSQMNEFLELHLEGGKDL